MAAGRTKLGLRKIKAAVKLQIVCGMGERRTAIETFRPLESRHDCTFKCINN